MPGIRVLSAAGILLSPQASGQGGQRGRLRLQPGGSGGGLRGQVQGAEQGELPLDRLQRPPHQPPPRECECLLPWDDTSPISQFIPVRPYWWPCLGFPNQLFSLFPLPQCSMGPSSDKALTFMKDHFLMDGKVAPTQGRPLLVKTDVKYTRIAVDETPGILGTVYRVMFLATGGFVHGEPARPPCAAPVTTFGVGDGPHGDPPVPRQRRVSCTRRWSCLWAHTSWRASSSSARRSR